MFSCELFFADANIAVCFVKRDALPVVLTRQIATWRLQNENKIMLNYFIYLCICSFFWVFYYYFFFNISVLELQQLQKENIQQLQIKYELSLTKFPLLDAHSRTTTHTHTHAIALCVRITREIKKHVSKLYIFKGTLTPFDIMSLPIIVPFCTLAI